MDIVGLTIEEDSIISWDSSFLSTVVLSAYLPELWDLRSMDEITGLSLEGVSGRGLSEIGIVRNGEDRLSVETGLLLAGFSSGGISGSFMYFADLTGRDTVDCDDAFWDDVNDSCVI